jgi:hypothetical protein
MDQARENGDWKRLRRGWCLGSKEFKADLLDLAGERREFAGEGEALVEIEEHKAERLIQGWLRKQGWTEKELQQRPKGDKVKVGMAKELRKETTLTWPWIAHRLGMGHWRTAVNAVRLISR